MTAIDDKYAALGGSGGPLGQPTSPENKRRPMGGDADAISSRAGSIGRPKLARTESTERLVGNGTNLIVKGASWAIRSPMKQLPRTAAGGTITSSTAQSTGTPQSDAHEVHGLIREKWSSLGWERSFLGYPLTDETSTPDGRGRYNHFQGGSIYWTPQTTAHEVHGAIRDKWAALGWERSFLGYPITDELETPGPGRFSRFQGGAIHWTPYTGPREVQGVGSHYVISLDKFHIFNTRSLHEDTDHVNFSLKIGSTMQQSLTRDTGDVNNGDHLVGLCLAASPFRIRRHLSCSIIKF